MISGHARLDQISGQNSSSQSVADPGFGQAAQKILQMKGVNVSQGSGIYLCQFTCICILPFFLLPFLQTIRLALM